MAHLVCRLLLEKNFFNDTATTEIYTLSLHDALPISQYAPELRDTRYSAEMWSLYKEGKLDMDTVLTGEFIEPDTAADVDSVMAEIQAVLSEERERVARANAEDFEDF